MRVLFLSFGLIIADQLTKLIVKGITLPALGIAIEGMSYGESIPIIGEWLNITYIENPNMAFGLSIGGKLYLVIFSFLASVGLVYYLYRHKNAGLLLRLSLALILAGAVGNLIDRTLYGVLYETAPLFYGNVDIKKIDDLFTITFSESSFKFWPIFNIADAAVSVGVVMLLIIGLPHTEKTVEASSEDVAANDDSGTTPGNGHA